MVWHDEKTLKTTIQENLIKISRICKYNNSGGVSLQWNNLFFFSVHSNFSSDSEAYDLMKPYSETSHSESNRTAVVDLFCGNWLTYYRLKKIWRAFPTGIKQGNLGLPLPPNSLGLHKKQKQQYETLDSPHVLISLSKIRDKNIKNSSAM